MYEETSFARLGGFFNVGHARRPDDRDKLHSNDRPREVPR